MMCIELAAQRLDIDLRVDPAWEQEKPEATLREMLAEGAAHRRRQQSHAACAGLVKESGASTYDAGVLFHQRNN